MVKNVKVVCRNKVVRLSSARHDQLVAYFNLSVGTEITGELNGRKVRFQYISGEGFKWVEA